MYVYGNDPLQDAAYIVPIDAVTGKAKPSIHVGGGIGDLAITPDGATIYASTYQGTIVPIHTASNTLGTPMTIGGGLGALAITPDGNTAFVVDFHANDVVPIDLMSKRADAAINVGATQGGGDLSEIAMTPDGSKAFVVNSAARTITPINTRTEQPGTPVQMNGGLDSLAISADGRALVTDNVYRRPDLQNADGFVIPLDTSLDQLGTPIHIGGLLGKVAFAPHGDSALVLDPSLGTLTPVDVATRHVGSAIRVGGKVWPGGVLDFVIAPHAD